VLMVEVIIAVIRKKDFKGHLCRVRVELVLKSSIEKRAGRTLCTLILALVLLGASGTFVQFGQSTNRLLHLKRQFPRDR